MASGFCLLLLVLMVEFVIRVYATLVREKCQMNKYKLAAVGGTFDRIHSGHLQLLNLAFSVADRVVIGLTNQNLVKGKELSNIILPYTDRKQELIELINREGWKNRAEIIQLNDPYGPTVNGMQFDVLVVSRQTLPGAKEINRLRHTKKLDKLPIKVAKLVIDQSGRYISSTRIRQGQINRQGLVYSQIFNQDHNVKPQSISVLKHPLGQLLYVPNKEEVRQHASRANKLVLVGDVVTRWFVDQGLKFDLAIVDGMTKREITSAIDFGDLPVTSGTNPPGTIKSQIVEHLRKSLELTPSVVRINGEEDLLVLPMILLLPLTSLVVYGQPDKGMVLVEVSENTKKKVVSLLV